MNNERLLTSSEAARIAGVSKYTILRAVESGQLHAVIVGAVGMRLVERGDVEAFAHERAERRRTRRSAS